MSGSLSSLYLGDFCGFNQAKIVDSHVAALDSKIPYVSLNGITSWKYGTIFIGGFTGYDLGASYERCGINGTVTIDDKNQKIELGVEQNIGGFVGYSNGNTGIKHCYATPIINNLSNNAYFGGFVGKIQKGVSIENSYSAVNFTRYTDTASKRTYNGKCGMFAGNISEGLKVINSFAVQTISSNTDDTNWW
jgi:hypothetical protein